ncbi:sigma factor-like helix-turn-helix DNA-binding protein, partial [Paenibacillus sp. MCAF20]
GVIYFNDWSEDRLRELYRHQPKLLHDVLVQLWFYGFDFQDELGRFIKLERPDEWAAVPALKTGLMLEDILTLDVVRQMERFGIRTTDQLVGVPEYSLQWLFRIRYEAVKDALYPYFLMESAGGTGGAEEQIEPVAHVVRSAGYEIEIPMHLLNSPIRDLPIYGCDALLSGIVNSCNITVLGQLPLDLVSLLPSIKGAGSGALEKMAKQLSSFINAQGESGQVVPEEVTSSSLTDQFANQSYKLIWQDQVIELSDSDLNMRLRPEEYPSVKRVTQYLEEQGIEDVSGLPTFMEQLSAGDRVGKTSIDKFVSQLLLRLGEHRMETQMREQLEAMSLSDRIDYSLRRTEDKLAVKLTKEELHENRNLQILYSRWLERKEGRKATLEWLGQKFGLTRERVRQIMPKVLRSFHPDVVDLERVLKEACVSPSSFFYYPMNVNDDFLHGLIEQVVEEFDGLVYLERYGWWTIKSQEEVDQTEEYLRQHLNTRLRGHVWEEAALQGIIVEALKDDALPLELAWKIVASDLAMTMEGNFYLANSKKWEVVEMVLRQFPEGVEVYKREEELMSLANIIKPGEYNKERDFASVFVRDEFLDIAYLWGRGAFIHRDYVHVNESIVREVSDKALELLEKRSPISVNRLFPLYEQRLQESGIPTEYALYTMLRKLGSSKLAPNKFPHIWHADDAFQLSNAEQIKVYIREHYEPIAVERLREEFVGKRGWKRFTLEFSIQYDSDFVSTDLGVVGLREFYPYTSSDLTPITDKLQELLAETGVIHVNRLYELMSDACTTLGIGSSYLLYDLLKGTDGSIFRMVRYPLILSADHPAEELTLQTLVEQYLEEQEAEVAREVVYHWVTEEVGARAETLDGVLAASKDIFFYQDGQFGEYIHRKRFGWTDEIASRLVDAVNNELNQLELEGVPYTTIALMMDRLQLPELENNLAWTEDLLKDCLRKTNSFQLLGSYDHIFVRRDHPVISCETDWLTYLLRSEYGGRASRVDWQRRLAELKYSKDGRFLFETAAKLENGSAPFLMTNDDVMLVNVE